MIKRLLFYVLLLTNCHLKAQKKHILAIDTSIETVNTYLVDIKLTNDFNTAIGNQDIDPSSVNMSLLRESILYQINLWRKNNNKEQFSSNKKLDAIANSYVEHYGKSRFSSTSTNYHRLQGYLAKTYKYLDLEFSFIKGNVMYPYLVDYKRGDYFYDSSIKTSEVDLYFGIKSAIDSNHVAKPIKSKTYNQLAEEVLAYLKSGRSARLLKSNAYQLMSIAVVPSNLKTKRVRQFKLVFLVGGYRVKFVSEFI